VTLATPRGPRKKRTITAASLRTGAGKSKSQGGQREHCGARATEGKILRRKGEKCPVSLTRRRSGRQRHRFHDKNEKNHKNQERMTEGVKGFV